MFKIYSLSFLLLIFFNAAAQISATSINTRIGIIPGISSPTAGLFVDLTDGKPVMVRNLASIEGSPYLSESWRTGNVLVKGNKVFRQVPLKYNIYNQELYFSKQGQEMVFIDSVREFEFTWFNQTDSVHSYFRNGFPAIDGFTKANFFEVLAEGRYTLLKSYKKELIIEQPMNRPSKEVIKDINALYLYSQDDKIVRIRADKKSVLGLFLGNEKMIEDIISTNKLKIKGEKDLQALFIILNSKPLN